MSLIMAFSRRLMVIIERFSIQDEVELLNEIVD
jgi:hypothetical protein